MIVFDINETLSDMNPMALRFADVGAPEHLTKLWFATPLRDGFALTAAGAQRPFAQLGVDALLTVLHGAQLNRDLNAAVDHVMSGFSELPVHERRTDGVRALRRPGHRRDQPHRHALPQLLHSAVVDRSPPAHLATQLA
jgi:2-haloacid dehalogenase